MMDPPSTIPIPVVVLTGFLGSGKTTLLARLLKSPSLARTAVLINEFGEVGLDHELVAASDESFVTLQTGCLCCTIRGDLVLTLQDLLARRASGDVMAFERIVIETSGLADPAPILQALMTDAALAERLTLAGVVTTVDAVTGSATLDRQPESVRQVAVADRLILTKTDLGAAGEDVGLLMARLEELNPLAPVEVASFGNLPADAVLDFSSLDVGRMALDSVRAQIVGGASGAPHAPGHSHTHTHDQDRNRHDAAISCFAVLREKPLSAVTVPLLLEILAEHCGADLLRMKAIVNIAEHPDRPVVLHGVQHVFHAPDWLEAWPSADRRSRLVFIGRNLSQPWIEAVIAAIEAEVAGVVG